MTGEELKDARTRLGLSQEALARALELSVTSVNRYERGRQAIPRVVELAVVQVVARNVPRQT